MAEIVNGLFGIDPDQYRQQQQLLQSNQNMQLAKMDPMEAARYSLMQGGTQLGNVGMQLMGVQDPMLVAATELKQLASQYDTTSPQGLMELAQAIKGKYPQQAQQAVAAANKMLLDKASIYQKTGENMNSLISSGKFTPASLAVYAKTRNPGDLDPLVTPEKLGESTVKEIATAEKNNTILTNSNKKLDDWITQTEAGEVQFGLGPRALAIGQRFTGKQDANTRKLDSLSKFMETERNNILLAAKGTQTEGDATRAMDQILKNTDLNNQDSVLQALSDLKAYKESQVAGNNTYIESLKGTRKIGGSNAPSEKPKDKSEAPAVSKSIYSRVRAQKGWEDASQEEIDSAIKAGKIKVGPIK